ncbi:Xaa-Pro aminopeptidase [Desulfosporosinus orientis DSM 765]|uniref:Xaa-Pro aminopeptidase n=1 Tax=Desulfosporosinus orientis (strain ATCC 19365 / DSM 765 / NCIMB 8382 / VKM B-1628 / Singapore I) TaxID=768706 RepID=G7WE14_DESOD|nr:Xaa-Pro peptidase family protein [Desulfosporosinus orientis]AET69412.1 Xaa-Pro aminopeptidase [Desulfosporosinus orientis DSM 765]
MADYNLRIKKVQKIMKEAGTDYLVLAPSANLLYLTGLKTTADERLQIFMLPAEGMPVMILPEMYREMAEHLEVEPFELLTWADGSDPVDLLRPLVLHPSGSAAIDERMWAGHFLALSKAFAGFEFLGASGVMRQVRVLKDEDELRLLERAGGLTDQVMDQVLKMIKPGISERELSIFVESKLKEYGAEDLSFKPIIASGPHTSSPHHNTGERKLVLGDLVVLDFGGLFQGYCSDMTRTFSLGKASDDVKRIYNLVRDANEAGFQAVREGVSCERVDEAARRVIAEGGYGEYFVHRTGHGIGMDIHEEPYIVSGNQEILKPGMTFSIEPGIYLPGQYGVRIEDIAGLSPQGAIRFNNFPRELIEV